MDQVDLLTLIKDWHDRTKHPLISITRSDHISWDSGSITLKLDTRIALGHIWIGDFDVANIFAQGVFFAGWKPADGLYPPYDRLNAADPEFFGKLSQMLTYLTDLLKE